jgi:hypothetical protein
MKSSELALLVGGLGVLYLIMQSKGASAAAASIASTNLTAGTTVANTQLVANSAGSIAQDIGNIVAVWD